MPTYSINTVGFVKWEGPPPQLVKQHIARFTKTGQAGFSAQLLGIYGDPFDVTLTAVIPNQAAGTILEEFYRTLIGASTQTVVYNDVDYSFRFNHTYLVENVETVSFKRHPLLIGPTYSYPGGWVLKSRWLLIPYTA
jgi:hypothetical protein